jgi:hypothetical protein
MGRSGVGEYAFKQAGAGLDEGVDSRAEASLGGLDHQDTPELRVHLVPHGDVKVFHVGEVTENRTDPHPRAFGHALGGGLTISLADQVENRLDDGLAASLGAKGSAVGDFVPS